MQTCRRSVVGQVRPQPSSPERGLTAELAPTPASGGLQRRKASTATRGMLVPAAQRKSHSDDQGPVVVGVKSSPSTSLVAQGRRHRQYCLTGNPRAGG